MSTHNICFHGEIRKYLPDTSSYLEQCIHIQCIVQVIISHCQIIPKEAESVYHA